MLVTSPSSFLLVYGVIITTMKQMRQPFCHTDADDVPFGPVSLVGAEHLCHSLCVSTMSHHTHSPFSFTAAVFGAQQQVKSAQQIPRVINMLQFNI